MFILFFSGAKFSRDSETQLKKKKKTARPTFKIKKTAGKTPYCTLFTEKSENHVSGTYLPVKKIKIKRTFGIKTEVLENFNAENSGKTENPGKNKSVKYVTGAGLSGTMGGGNSLGYKLKVL